MTDINDLDFDSDVDAEEQRDQNASGISPEPKRKLTRLGAEAKRVEYDEARRDHWAVAAIAGICYLLLFSGGYLLFRDRWNDFVVGIRAALLFVALTLTYAVSYIGSRTSNKQIAKLFAIFGTLFYGLTLAALSKHAPSNIDTHAAVGQILTRAFPAILPFWAIGAFALAAAIRSRLMHYIAALIALLWLAVDASGFDALFVVVFCAIGEYWAWRRRSASVSVLYLALCVYSICFEPSLWTRPESYAFVCVAFSVMLYWYGATFNNAIIRGTALVLASIALGYASFPQYWEHAFSDRVVERLGKPLAIYAPSLVCTAAFVAYCVNVTLGGAQHCTARFAFGVFSLVGWSIGLTFHANRSFGVAGAVCVLFVVALAFITLLYLNAKLAKKRQYKKSANVRNFVLPETDHLDDLVDAEARRTQDSAPVFALAEEYRDFVQHFLRRANTPLMFAAIALQYAFLIVNLIVQLR